MRAFCQEIVDVTEVVEPRVCDEGHVRPERA